MGFKDVSVDLVYMWVDGNDPAWLAKKQRFMDKKTNIAGRFQDNQELKYSLRSAEKHLPWIRKIFIVTDGQIPSFLNVSHPKIEVIDHSQIIPKENLPLFNSISIEYNIYKIPGLSEHFLLANDDTFVNADLSPSFFFQDGIPVMRMVYNPFMELKLKLKKALKLRVNTHRLAIENAYKLFKEKFNVFYPISQHHNIDAYLKSDFKAVVEEVFKEELAAVLSNRFRAKTDIQRVLVNYFGLVNKRGILKYVGRKESGRMRVHRTNYQEYIAKYNPQLFCINDSEHATDAHRAQVEPFLKKLFPLKSAFEK